MLARVVIVDAELSEQPPWYKYRTESERGKDERKEDRVTSIGVCVSWAVPVAVPVPVPCCGPRGKAMQCMLLTFGPYVSHDWR